MESARNVKRDFSPLDEELELLPGGLTPSLQEDVVRLGAWMPFQEVVKQVKYFRRTDISKSSAVRLTEAAGSAYVEVQKEEVLRIERELPVAPSGAEQQFMSVDGAMVPVVGGEWAEVKTLVVGDVLPPQRVNGEEVIRTTNHSYFSRLLDSTTFTRFALVETQRRGVENAEKVAAITDGAEWIQKFIDHHRHDAVRILDFPHAAEYVSDIAQIVRCEEGEQQEVWRSEQLHALKHLGAQSLLETLRAEISQVPTNAELAGALAYLEKRASHMHYPTFQAEGWPIGSGAVESANKLVVEARLKGSGMHWSRDNVDPMLALRNIACNNRWDEAWPQITCFLRREARKKSAQRRRRRHHLVSTSALSLVSHNDVSTSHELAEQSITMASFSDDSSSNSSSDSPACQPWRPPANHPWRHMPVGRARFN